MIKNLILDWSGTIANDIDFTLQATNATLIHFGAGPISKEEYIKNFKIPIDSFYKIYLPRTEIQHIDAYFFNWYQQNCSQIQLFEKIELVFDFAEKFFINLFICSTLSSETLITITTKKKITSKFNAIYGNCFNKINSLNKIITENNMLGDETLFIGDTTHDIEAAIQNKIRAGAVTYGYTPASIIRRCPADDFFNQPEDIFFRVCADYAPSYFKKPIVTVGGLVFDNNNQALFIRTKKWSDKWGIPGGKIQFNETMQNAFIREIKEETNLDIYDIELVLIQDCIQHHEFYLPRHFVLINYKAKTNSRDVKINYESEEFKWLPLSKALTMDLNEPTRTLINKVLE